MILDGFGAAPPGDSNAISTADTPNLDRLLADYPHTVLAASGEDVGLPAGQMGNSEVGHLNIGAGRIVYQDLTRIGLAIKDGSFFDNPALLQAVANAKEDGGALHLMGLLSDGGVHSHITHLYALLELAAKEGLRRVFIHIFLDGRDVPPRSALTYIRQLESKMRELGIGKIATVSGRYYAMDRDKRWDRVKLAYDAIVYGRGVPSASAEQAVEQSYSEGAADEFVMPAVVENQDLQPPEGRIQNGDSVIFFNFRSDRARELSWALVNKKFDGFDRGNRPPEVFFVCMAEYDNNLRAAIAFPTRELVNTLPDVISDLGLTQFHTAETEKYAHVTFFFNGGIEAPKPGERRVLIPSPKVATYDLKPEMSAFQVADAVCDNIDNGGFDLVIVNFANPDMVGHTGIMPATVKAIEVIDKVLKEVVSCVRAKGGELLIMADHGNAEKMSEDHEKPWTAHTANPVPLIYVTERPAVRLRPGGRLADVAPTVLDIMNIAVPKEMTGKSLIVES